MQGMEESRQLKFWLCSINTLGLTSSKAECNYSSKNSAVFQVDRLYKHQHTMLFRYPLAPFWLDSLSDHSSLQRNINCGNRLEFYGQ